MPHVETGPEIVHVFAADLSQDRLRALAGDADALGKALGGVAVDVSRVEVLDRDALGEIGLPSYLSEGEGADPEAVQPDAARLEKVRDPVLILRPRAVTETMQPQPPLSHLGSYPMERARPAGAPIRAASAEGSATGVPPAAPAPGSSDKRQSGMVATIALAVALLVAFVMWFVAS